MCFCRANKVVMNTPVFGIGCEGFGCPNGGECGVVGNILPISVYDCCRLFPNI